MPRNSGKRNPFPPVLRLQSLGELGLTGPTGDLLPGRRKELALLVYLAQRAPRPVRRAELAALLWEASDEKRAAHSLRQALLRLGRAIGDRLQIGPQAVALAPGTVDLDLSLFESALTEGRVAEAVGYWHGDFLAGLEELGGEAWRAWVDAERARARRRLAGALARLVGETGAAGDRAAALRWAERWMDLLPLDDAGARHLMELLAQDGRPEEARTFYADYAARLQRELGVAPAPETAAIGERLTRLPASPSATPVSRRPGSAALFSPDLVGRETARSELLSAWRTVADGHAAVVVVEAEEGMGKTLLCDAVLRSLADQATPPLLLRARAREEQSEPPWTVARELLGGLVAAPGLVGASPADLAQLSRLLPAVRERWPQFPDPRSDQAIPAGAVARVLAVVAEEAPVVLFVDDVGHADQASRALLTELARLLPPGVLLLVTHGVTAAGGDTLAALTHIPGVRRLKLPPLDVDDVEAMLGSMLALPAADRRRLAERLHRETGGNPLYASEVVGAMVDEGHLTQDGRGFWTLAISEDDGALPLPPTVREAVARRLARLGDLASRIMTAAAALDEPVTGARLAEATGLDAGSVQDGLYDLLAGRLLRHSAVLPDAVEFMHPIIRRVARERGGLETGPAARPGARVRRRAWLVAGTAVALLAVAFAMALTRGGSGAAPTLAVGLVDDETGAASGEPGPPLRGMLATSLARVPGIHVISTARLYEILGHLDAPLTARASYVTAARHAGATALLEGTLRRDPDGGLRLELWRLDLQSGEIRDRMSVEAAEPFALADRATARVTAHLGKTSPHLRLADVTTHSLAAHRQYEDGLRSYALGEYGRALEHFREALTADSLFAMAALYAWRSAVAVDSPPPVPPDRLTGMATRAPERERLLIRVAVGFTQNEPDVLALAETLAVRYPVEPDAHLWLGIVRMTDGDFLGAVQPLRRVIADDSLGLRWSGARCRACVAFAHLTSAYTAVDSAASGERVAREWMRLQPAAPEPWRWIGAALAAQGRHDEARAAFRTAAAASRPDRPNVSEFLPLTVRMLTEDLTAIDTALTDLIRRGSVEQRRDALWYLTISQRHQGRPSAALATVRRLEAELGTDPLSRIPVTGLRAQVLYELGRYAEAARVFDSLATFPPDILRGGQLARHKSWYLAHLATAVAAAGDTGTLRSLVEPLRNWGRRSLHGRDRRLHHHARGLLLAARGAHAEAVEEFQRAIYSPNLGYTRTNYELARSLLALQRPREAAAVLDAALRGSLDGPNLYITRTDLRALLSRAYLDAGMRDRAGGHLEQVLAAWRNAEPPLLARRDSLQRMLARVE